MKLTQHSGAHRIFEKDAQTQVRKCEAQVLRHARSLRTENSNGVAGGDRARREDAAGARLLPTRAIRAAPRCLTLLNALVASFVLPTSGTRAEHAGVHASCPSVRRKAAADEGADLSWSRCTDTFCHAAMSTAIAGLRHSPRLHSDPAIGTAHHRYLIAPEWRQVLAAFVFHLCRLT